MTTNPIDENLAAKISGYDRLKMSVQDNGKDYVISFPDLKIAIEIPKGPVNVSQSAQEEWKRFAERAQKEGWWPYKTVNE